MDVFTLIWFLSLHGVNTAMYLAVTRVAYGWPKTLLGLSIYYVATAAGVSIARFTGYSPQHFTPLGFPVGFGTWFAVTMALSRRGTRSAAFFEAVLCGAHQLAASGVCYILMFNIQPMALGKVLASVLLLSMGAGMIRLLLPRVRRLSHLVDWRPLNVIVSFLLALVYATNIWPIWVADGPWREAIPFAVAVATLVSFFPVIYLLAEKSQAAARLKEVEDNTRLLLAELRTARASEDGARRVRHDARHHIGVVREMLAAGRVAETDEYLANLANHEVLGSSGRRRWCGNALIDALLSIAERKAVAHGRHFTVRADVPEAFPLNEADVVSLVGNLLENAIRHGAEGEIRVSVVLDRGKVLRLSVANSVLPSFALANGLPAGVEGVGLTSVRRVVEKYHGVMGYKVNGNELICKVAIGCA